MYGKGTDYTARSEAQIDHFGVTADNEISAKLGADMHTIMRSAALDGGAVSRLVGVPVFKTLWEIQPRHNAFILIFLNYRR